MSEDQLPDWAKGLDIPTKEESFQEMLDAPKLENNNENSEAVAKKFLIDTACPYFHVIDGNPVYDKEKKRRQRSKNLSPMLTPDFVVGHEPVEANNPEDFYIDVNEITESVWGNFKDDNPNFNCGNPVKHMLEAARDAKPGDYTSENPYRMVVTELAPNLIKKLYQTIQSKALKYSSKREGSNNFGLISVLAEDRNEIAIVHYQKLIISIFDDMLFPPLTKHLPEQQLDKIHKLKTDILKIATPQGIVPILAPFEGPWCFWAILGTGPYQGECLILINSSVLKSYPEDDKMAIWINELIKNNQPLK